MIKHQIPHNPQDGHGNNRIQQDAFQDLSCKTKASDCPVVSLTAAAGTATTAASDRRTVVTTGSDSGWGLASIRRLGAANSFANLKIKKMVKKCKENLYGWQQPVVYNLEWRKLNSIKCSLFYELPTRRHSYSFTSAYVTRIAFVWRD